MKKMKWKKSVCRSLALLLTLVMLAGVVTPIGAVALQMSQSVAVGESILPIAGMAGRDEGEKLYRVWFNTPAHNRTPNTTNTTAVHVRDHDWEFLSIPIGNGFHGASIFGRTYTERITFTENSLFNPAPAGLNTFMTFYIDFGHNWQSVTNYFRELVLNDGTAAVQYTYNGVVFTREFVASHPDEVTAMRLTAHDVITGEPVPEALNVTFRPAVPFVRPQGFYWAGVRGKSAQVVADPVTGVIRLFGDMENFGIHYEAHVRILPQGGEMTRHNWRFNPAYSSSIEGVEPQLQGGPIPTSNVPGLMRGPNMYGGIERGRGLAYDAEGLRVEGADEILVLVALGTNYRQVMHSGNWSEVFSAAGDPGGWGFPANQNRLPRDPELPNWLSNTVDAARDKGWQQIRADHVADYTQFFNRARLNLGGTAEDAFTLTTHERINRYRQPGQAVFDPYLEELIWQFGRYLLICSSREGTLPAHLQGIWTAYEHTPWSGGYWHNINLQMNYWPAFNTNLADLFQSYADFNAAFRPAAQRLADTYLSGYQAVARPGYRPEMSGPVGRNLAPAGQGRNGWIVGTGVWPYHVGGPSFTDHSGPGTGGMTSSLFWEYWDFTRDLNILQNVTWPAVEGMAQFLMRTLRWCDNEQLYLVWYSASPELLWINPIQGRQYYRTIGSLFDQQMVYDVYRTTIDAAHILRDAGIDQAVDWTFIDQITRERDLLAPVIVGASGQVKEYREELFYGEITDEWRHRHISHLLGLYPGTAFNDRPHWMDAARTTLDYRGDGVTGWSQSHTLHFRARMGEGNHSYMILRNFLRQHVRYNLKAQHEPFQIDGNFGSISGMAEMLLQSHEGFISLLPARPDTWASGSFEGLPARGGFEVDARWQNHILQELTIHSNVGEVAYVRYFNIANATVRTSSGAPVSFTVVTERAGVPGTDLIRFNTVVGESYIITGFPPFTLTAPATNLEVETGLFYNNGERKPGVSLRWNPSFNAANYRIYVAMNSDPDYTYVGTTTSTSFTHFVDSEVTQGNQFTYRIVAVAPNGRASSGITRVIIPARPPVEAEAMIAEDGALGVYITPERATAQGSRRGTPTTIPVPNVFRLYEMRGEVFTQIAESRFPVIYVNADAIENIENDFYVVGYDHVTGTAAIDELRATGGPTPVIIVEPDGEPQIIENVFLQRPVTTIPANTVSGFPAANLVDGGMGTRFAVYDGQAGGVVVAEIVLEREVRLENIRISEYSRRSRNTDFEVFTTNGGWQTVFAGYDLPGGPQVPGGVGTYTITFDAGDRFELYPVYASRVRFTFRQLTAPLGAAPTFFELQSRGILGAVQAVNKAALIAALESAVDIDSQLGFGIGMNPTVYSRFRAAVEAGFELLDDRTATQEAVNAVIFELEEVIGLLPEASYIALGEIAQEATVFVAGLDPDDPLYIEGAAREIREALEQANAVMIQIGGNPQLLNMPAINAALSRLRAALDHYELFQNRDISMTNGAGGIFAGQLTIVVTQTNEAITQFRYTLDGSDPTAASTNVIFRPTMNVVLPYGVHNFRIAGFIGNERATDIIGAEFLIVEGDNLARMSQVSAVAPNFVPGHGPELAIDGNSGSRWAALGAAPWFEVNLGESAIVGAVVIREFVEPAEQTRLGTNFVMQYYNEGWQDIFRGNGNQSPAFWTVPQSGVRVRVGPQHQAHGVIFDTPVTAQRFRIADMPGGPSIWEFELYGAPSGYVPSDQIAAAIALVDAASPVEITVARAADTTEAIKAAAIMERLNSLPGISELGVTLSVYLIDGQWAVRVTDGINDGTTIVEVTTVFVGTNPNEIRTILNESDVSLDVRGNLGIFTHHSPFVIPVGRTLTVISTLNVQGGAELVIEGTLVVLEGGRVNNQGGAGGTISIADGGSLVNYGHVENVTNSAVINYGLITNNNRFEVRAGTRLHDCGVVVGTLNIHRNAVICNYCQ